MQNHTKYLDEAFSLANHSVRNNLGGPFGAVVVLDGKIIGKGGNRVITENDPTAHAEIVAIREACREIRHFDLSGATLYATCEPCPMCLSAIYWSNIGEVYYCLTRHQADAIGFRDHHIYQELSLDPSQRTLPFHRINHPGAEALFSEWMDKKDKMVY